MNAALLTDAHPGPPLLWRMVCHKHQVKRNITSSGSLSHTTPLGLPGVLRRVCYEVLCVAMLRCREVKRSLSHIEEVLGVRLRSYVRVFRAAALQHLPLPWAYLE